MNPDVLAVCVTVLLCWTMLIAVCWKKKVSVDKEVQVDVT